MVIDAPGQQSYLPGVRQLSYSVVAAVLTSIGGLFEVAIGFLELPTSTVALGGLCIVLVIVIIELLVYIRSLHEAGSGVATQHIEQRKFRDDWFSRAIGIREKVGEVDSLESIQRVRKDFVDSILEMIQVRIQLDGQLDGFRVTYFSYEDNGNPTLKPFASCGVRSKPTFVIDNSSNFGKYILKFFGICIAHRVGSFSEIPEIRVDKGGLNSAVDFESFAFASVVRSPGAIRFGIFMIDHASPNVIEPLHQEILHNIAILCADGKFAILEQGKELGEGGERLGN